MKKRRIIDIYAELDAAESSKDDDDDDGKIRNQVVEDPKPCSDAHNQGLNSEPSGKIDHGKKPERRSNDSSSCVVRQSSGKYSAQFKDPNKKKKEWLGMFDTEEEANLAVRRKQLEVFSRSMLAVAPDVLRQDKADEVLLDVKPVQSADDPFELVAPSPVLDASSSVKSQLNGTNNVVVEGGKDPPAVVASVEGALRENTVAAEGGEDDDDLKEGLLVSGLLEEPELSFFSL